METRAHRWHPPKLWSRKNLVLLPQTHSKSQSTKRRTNFWCWNFGQKRCALCMGDCDTGASRLIRKSNFYLYKWNPFQWSEFWIKCADQFLWEIYIHVISIGLRMNWEIGLAIHIRIKRDALRFKDPPPLCPPLRPSIWLKKHSQELQLSQWIDKSLSDKLWKFYCNFMEFYGVFSI